jgi:hypothetical protein
MKKYLRTVKSWFVKSPSVYNPKPLPKTTHLEIVWLSILNVTLDKQENDGWFSSKELILEVNQSFDLTPLQVYRVLTKLQKIGKLHRKKSTTKEEPNLYKFVPN